MTGRNAWATLSRAWTAPDKTLAGTRSGYFHAVGGARPAIPIPFCRAPAPGAAG